MRLRRIATCVLLVAACLTADATSASATHYTFQSERASAVTTADSTPFLDSRRDCVYSGGRLAVLQTFENLIGRDYDCAMVFNDAAPTWDGWTHPYFDSISHPYDDFNWQKWVQGAPNRQIVITENMFPTSENKTDWLHRGAAGEFIPYAKQLAANLIAAGMSNAVIRLGHEANGTWYADSIPGDPQGDALWAQFWRNTALAMKSVPGAHFLFDWTIAAMYRNIPLKDFYPGDDAVDIVGIDAYDSGIPTGVDRWSYLYGRPDGIGDVLRFAQAHGKPLSIPEWGLAPTTGNFTGVGDDPAYVNGIANVVRSNRVAYQSYFYREASGTALDQSPLSVAAYRAHFGPAGDSVGPAKPVGGTRCRIRARRHAKPTRRRRHVRARRHRPARRSSASTPHVAVTTPPASTARPAPPAPACGAPARIVDIPAL
jgi:hypothetical protein